MKRPLLAPISSEQAKLFLIKMHSLGYAWNGWMSCEGAYADLVVGGINFSNIWFEANVGDKNLYCYDISVGNKPNFNETTLVNSVQHFISYCTIQGKKVNYNVGEEYFYHDIDLEDDITN